MNETHESKVVYLRLDDIIPNRFQPREIFDETGLQELSDSIKEHGVLQPIIVRELGDKYELIAGERRTKASAMAGLTTIPAIIKNMDDKESAKVSLLENLQRKNLSAIEEARTYKRILELDNMTQEDLARTMGRSQPMIANKLRLLSLPEEIQEALMRNQISERHARSLLTIKNKKDQLFFLDKIKKERLTVRELDSEIKKYKENPDEFTDLSESNQELLSEIDDNKDERSFMNNNRGNFGGMGLNDYQSGIGNNMFNNIPTNFNNNSNMNNQVNNQFNYNNFDDNSGQTNDSQTNDYFANMNQNNNQINNNQGDSLGSMFDNYNNEPDNYQNDSTDNSNLFVSHIREDNLPKVDNQFLPNFDNFNQNDINDNDDGDGSREALNNFNQNNSFNDLNNQNSFNYNLNDNYNAMNNNYNSNYNYDNMNNNINNGYQNEFNQNNAFNNYNQNNMMNTQFNMNNNSFGMNSNYNDGFNNLNNNYNSNMNNNMNNNFDMSNNYNINNPGILNNSISNDNYFMNDLNNNMNNQNNMMNPSFNVNNGMNSMNNGLGVNTNLNQNNNMGQTSYNSPMPDYNNNFGMNLNMYQPNQGGMFEQPLNIIDVPKSNPMPNVENINSLNDNNNQINIEQNDNDNNLFSNPVSMPSDDSNENVNLEKEVELENTAVDDNTEIAPAESELEVIGEVNSLEDNNENSDEKNKSNDYISLDPVYTINSTMDAVMELKKTTDRIKQNKIDIETEEIDFGDVYQITIKIKKTDTL